MRAKNKAIQFPKISAPKKGKVLYFPNCNPDLATIPLPKTATAFDRFLEFEVNSDALKKYGIERTDFLTCRTNFLMSEITPKTICIMRTKNGGLFARTVKFNKKQKKIIFNCGKVERFDDVEFLAVAVELRKPLVFL